MPNMDGTGPARGKVGRGFGHCGCGERRGFLGKRQMSQLPKTKEEEKNALSEEIALLDARKQAIDARMKELA